MGFQGVPIPLCYFAEIYALACLKNIDLAVVPNISFNEASARLPSVRPETALLP